MERPSRGEDHVLTVNRRHNDGSPAGLRRLLPPESRLWTGSFGRPRAPGVRKLIDRVPILGRMLREPAISGECRPKRFSFLLTAPLGERK
jgi:hypothetical protein